MALKIWPEGGGSPARWTAISRLLAFLTKQGLHTVAVPVQNKQGACFTHWRRRMAHLEPWLPGEPVQGIPEETSLRSILHTVARWHLAAAKYMPEPQDQTELEPAGPGGSPALQTRWRHLQRLQEPGIKEQLAAEVFHRGELELVEFLLVFQQALKEQGDRLLQELPAAWQVLQPLQPVMKDLWRDHVLLTSGQVTGLIDTAAIETDSVLTDLTRLLGSLLGNQIDLWLTALRFYQELRPLSPEEKRLLPLYDLSNLLLSSWFCLEKYLHQQRQQRQESPIPDGEQPSRQQGKPQTQRLRERLDGYLLRLKTCSVFQQSLENSLRNPQIFLP